MILTLACLVGILVSVLPAGRRRRLRTERADKPRNCPLCGSALAPGERVKSYRFRAPPGGEDRIHLLECPHCRKSGGPSRHCPVCRESLPAGGYLVADMWREEDRTRVHVLGCSRCRVYPPHSGT